MKPKTLQQQLTGFLAKYTPQVAAVAKKALTKMRKRLPGAIELVYDNYNFLVIGFGPSERASEAIFSIVLAPRWVFLCFLLSGTKLPDPQKLLRGGGKRVRNVRLDTAATLDDPAVEALIAAALSLAVKPIDPAGRRHMIIKSISAKQRPRRPK